MTSLNLSGRVAALIAAAAVLIVLIAGWTLLVSPERSKADSLAGQTDQVQAQVLSTQAYVDNPATKRAVHDLKRLQAILPDDPKVSQILRQLSGMATVAGIQLNSITPTALVPSSGGEALPIALSITGHYFNIGRFLQLLRAQAVADGSTIVGTGRLYSVDGIQFTGGANPSVAAGGGAAASTSTSGSAPISATLKLNAFVYAPVAATPVTTTSTTTTTTTP